MSFPLTTASPASLGLDEHALERLHEIITATSPRAAIRALSSPWPGRGSSLCTRASAMPAWFPTA